jgi:hypothetical protein
MRSARCSRGSRTPRRCGRWRRCFHHVAEALVTVGAARGWVALVREYWDGMLDAGADTFWECFDLLDARRSAYRNCRNNSYCHAWSCTPGYLLRIVV